MIDKDPYEPTSMIECHKGFVTVAHLKKKNKTKQAYPHPTPPHTKRQQNQS